MAIFERDDPCDLMVVDLVMTGLSGADTVRLARRTRPDLRVLYSSGYADMFRFHQRGASRANLRSPARLASLADRSL
jgi:DNA-binding NarL/FixJ family response regulator